MQWLSDNGLCYTAHETIRFGRMLGFEVCTIPAYCSESNGMAEAFVKRIKRDYVYVSDLSDAQSVMEQLALWINDYNENALHKPGYFLLLRVKVNFFGLESLTSLGLS